MSHLVDCLHYGGFQSYGVKPIATSKPGTSNYYVKDAYKDISDYNKRRVNYFEDKTRWNSVYDKDMVKTVREKDYAENKNGNKLSLDKYEYCHEEDLLKIVTEGKKKNEESIRSRYAQSTDGFNRRKMFSNWQTNYDAENEKTMKIKAEKKFEKSEVPYWFKNNYHNYHVGSYKTDHTQSMGIHGDNPKEKFNQTMRNTQVKGKLFSDNYDIALGTSKASNFVPGYGGFIPINSFEAKNSLVKDPYFNVGKTNHMLNYRTRMTGYSGHKPENPNNLKGITRPYCLSTKDEKFS